MKPIISSFCLHHSLSLSLCDVSPVNQSTCICLDESNFLLRYNKSLSLSPSRHLHLFLRMREGCSNKHPQFPDFFLPIGHSLTLTTALLRPSPRDPRGVVTLAVKDGQWLQRIKTLKPRGEGGLAEGGKEGGMVSRVTANQRSKRSQF